MTPDVGVNSRDLNPTDALPDRLLEQAELLKSLMVAHATNGSSSDTEYRALRSRLLEHPQTKNLVPKAVRVCRNLSEFWGAIKEVDATYAGRRKHLAEEFDPLLSFLEQSSLTPSDALTSQALQRLDVDYVAELWSKAIERRATDPEGAITLARTLLEAVCKHILCSSGVSFDDRADLPKLYSQVAKELSLSPAQHTEDIFKQILGGCHSIVQGLGSLRSKLGDAHAQGAKRVKPSARHAELAVNLSGTMATFLLATWEQRVQN